MLGSPRQDRCRSTRGLAPVATTHRPARYQRISVLLAAPLLRFRAVVCFYSAASSMGRSIEVSPDPANIFFRLDYDSWEMGLLGRGKGTGVYNILDGGSYGMPTEFDFF